MKPEIVNLFNIAVCIAINSTQCQTAYNLSSAEALYTHETSKLRSMKEKKAAALMNFDKPGVSWPKNMQRID